MYWAQISRSVVDGCSRGRCSIGLSCFCYVVTQKRHGPIMRSENIKIKIKTFDKVLKKSDLNDLHWVTCSDIFLKKKLNILTHFERPLIIDTRVLFEIIQ